VSLIRSLTICFILFPSLVFAFCFKEAGREYGISSQLLETLARVESGMNPKAININVNGSYDVGLMQVNSFWLKAFTLDKERLMTDACYNVSTGARILKQCFDRYGYNWEAVGCYNASSLQKKINYSWKIFRALSAKPTQSTLSIDDRQTASSSLLFEVTDTAADRGGLP
jgi:soluble lytic murein transglycosylase-like protein